MNVTQYYGKKKKSIHSSQKCGYHGTQSWAQKQKTTYLLFRKIMTFFSFQMLLISILKNSNVSKYIKTIIYLDLYKNHA